MLVYIFSGNCSYSATHNRFRKYIHSLCPKVNRIIHSYSNPYFPVIKYSYCHIAYCFHMLLINMFPIFSFEVLWRENR